MVRVSNETFVDNLRQRNSELVKANRELREAQEKLLRAERLSMLGKFSSLILHDIRNPIGILRGFAEMLLLRPEDTETVTRYAGRIIAEADRLNRIAGDLLDFSRGKMTLNMSIVDPRDLIARVVEEVSERFAARGIEVRTVFADTGPVILDVDRMMRVFLNLADNSRKAMPKGGTFAIAVTREEKRIIFEVRDTGEGIEKEVKERLFEPFFTASKEGGTGLGMAIVKSIVDAHGGEVRIETRSHEGTAVRISIPILG
jgi:signal transduction histidine kinase